MTIWRKPHDGCRPEGRRLAGQTHPANSANAVQHADLRHHGHRSLRSRPVRGHDRLYGDELVVGYFDGVRARAGIAQAGRGAGLFPVGQALLVLPAPVALAVRLARHARREAAGSRAAKGFDVYHEVALPFLAAKRLARSSPARPVPGAAATLSSPRTGHVPSFARRWPLASGLIAVSEFTRSGTARGPLARSARVTLEAHDDGLPAAPAGGIADAPWARLGLPEQHVLTVGSGDPARRTSGSAPPAVRAAAPDAVLAAAGLVGLAGQGPTGEQACGLGIVSASDLADSVRAPWPGLHRRSTRVRPARPGA